MKTNKRPRKKTPNRLNASFDTITAKAVYAHEIHLGADTPTGRTGSLSIALDPQGNPVIEMTAAPAVNSQWPKKMIRIGFPQNQGQIWAEILCAITYGQEWEAVSMGVVDRVHPQRETYPEIVLSSIGNIRATIAASPSDGTPALVLHAPNSDGANYCLTNHGPVKDDSEIKQIYQQFDNQDVWLDF